MAQVNKVKAQSNFIPPKEQNWAKTVAKKDLLLSINVVIITVNLEHSNFQYERSTFGRNNLGKTIENINERNIQRRILEAAFTS